jgi:hypothetical protein
MARPLHAQEESKVYRWSFGISAGDILHQLFNSEESNKAYNAFVLEYGGGRYLLQAGFRPGYNKSDVSHEGFLDTEISEATNLSGSLALTRKLYSDHRWDIMAGLKYAGGYSREDVIQDSGFDRITTRRLQWNSGMGVVMDFRFRVHQRISLGTEASLLYTVSRSELQELFTNFPDFNTTRDIIEENSLVVYEPATIYLRYHF